ncbi:hypothetical protein U27_00719 [Candidatus Vecturithrix granuli]|uniref:DUF2281 domain-containing protein n=1 Tax=Vecturithrix granuli TaxID=1499967 RepID=A0A081C8B6_VECG1|nr:hypothetical protein U27_00719 [Candidatus Vecturithrix granuli]
MLTQQQLYRKVELLDLRQRETVSEFIDFLLSKRALPVPDSKTLLLRTSMWNEENIKRIEDVQKLKGQNSA